MQKYSSNLVELFYNSPYAGAITGADVIVKNQNETNDEMVKIYIVVRDNVLVNSSFQAKGSIVLYASLTTICAMSKGKSLDEILRFSEKDVINELKQLNKQEYSEIVFALESFKKAITTYSKRKAQGTIVERANQKTKNVLPSKNVTRFDNAQVRESEIEIALKNDTNTVEEKKEVKPKQETVVKKEVKKDDAPKKEAKQEVKQKETVANKNLQKLDKLISEVKLEEPKKKSEPKADNTEDSELLIVPVGGKKKSQKKEKSKVVIPTKIEVRVLDDEDKKIKTDKVVKKVTKVTTTKKVVKKAEENIPKENPYLLKQEPMIASDDAVIDEIDSITEQLTNAISQLNFTFDDDDKN